MSLTTVIFKSINIDEENKIAMIIIEEENIINLKRNLVTNINYDKDNAGNILESGYCDIPDWIAVQRGLIE